MNLFFVGRGVKLSFSTQKAAKEFALPEKKVLTEINLKWALDINFLLFLKIQPIEFTFHCFDLTKN
jgi:hypothetical protein